MHMIKRQRSREPPDRHMKHTQDVRQNMKHKRKMAGVL